jgi:hypothetical protein
VCLVSKLCSYSKVSLFLWAQNLKSLNCLIGYYIIIPIPSLSFANCISYLPLNSYLATLSLLSSNTSLAPPQDLCTDYSLLWIFLLISAVLSFALLSRILSDITSTRPVLRTYHNSLSFPHSLLLHTSCNNLSHFIIPFLTILSFLFPSGFLSQLQYKFSSTICVFCLFCSVM